MHQGECNRSTKGALGAFMVLRCASAALMMDLIALSHYTCFGLGNEIPVYKDSNMQKSITATSQKAHPFIKWVGGKGQLLEQLSALLPADLSKEKGLVYVEPFVGGGAMLFHMLSTYTNISHAVINDMNDDLVTTYKVVRDQPNPLIMRLREMQERYRRCKSEDIRKEYYLQERERYNGRGLSDIEIASLFIFLNRTCFNGLYRVNSKGLFNVPFGKAANPLICDEDTILADSELLQKVEICKGDFAAVENRAGRNAFFYFDPPYRPLTQTASFTAYDKSGFGDDQQIRLAKFCKHLDSQGHRWLLSNSDPHNVDPRDMFFEKAYEGFEIHRVTASRMINSKADGRGKITELAIRNYKEK